MQINKAKFSGFCAGVKRAFEEVEKEFGRERKNNVYILGPLVHNDNVAGMIKDWGVRTINQKSEIKENSTVIITAHGAGPGTYRAIRNRKAKVFDATCPKVASIHKLVRKYRLSGYEIAIFGDKDHKEVKGINGWCDNKALVVSCEAEAEVLLKNLARENKKAVLVSQTTQDEAVYGNIVDIFKKNSAIEANAFNTICGATSLRQKEARLLAKRNDFVIVIGGKNSGNTRRLFEITSKENSNCVWIEGLGDAEKCMIKEFIDKTSPASIGLISGASTPEWDIAKVESFLLEYHKRRKAKQRKRG